MIKMKGRGGAYECRLIFIYFNITKVKLRLPCQGRGMWTVPLKAIFCHVVSDLCWGYTGKDIMTIVPDTHSGNNGSIKIKCRQNAKLRNTLPRHISNRISNRIFTWAPPLRKCKWPVTSLVLTVWTCSSTRSVQVRSRLSVPNMYVNILK